MNQNAMELMAERLGMPKEEYAALQSGDWPSLLTSRFSDPLMATVIGSMLSQKPHKDETAEPEVDLARELARAQNFIRKLKQDLASADTMAVYIAEIFGACRACWGLNRLCSRCRGRGQPGFNTPYETELLAWLQPALDRLGWRIVRTKTGPQESDDAPLPSTMKKGRPSMQGE